MTSQSLGYNRDPNFFLHIWPQSVDSLNGGFFTRVFSAVGRLGKKRVIRERSHFKFSPIFGHFFFYRSFLECISRSAIQGINWQWPLHLSISSCIYAEDEAESIILWTKGWTLSFSIGTNANWWKGRVIKTNSNLPSYRTRRPLRTSLSWCEVLVTESIFKAITVPSIKYVMSPVLKHWCHLGFWVHIDQKQWCANPNPDLTA